MYVRCLDRTQMPHLHIHSSLHEDRGTLRLLSWLDEGHACSHSCRKLSQKRRSNLVMAHQPTCTLRAVRSCANRITRSRTYSATQTMMTTTTTTMTQSRAAAGAGRQQRRVEMMRLQMAPPLHTATASRTRLQASSTSCRTKACLMVTAPARYMTSWGKRHRHCPMQPRPLARRLLRQQVSPHRTLHCQQHSL